MDLKRIMKVVCGYYDVTEQEFLSNSRKDNIAYCRQMFFYLAKKHTKKSLEKIGKYANRIHSTVIFSVNKMATLELECEDVKNEIQKIEIRLSSKSFDELIINHVDLILICEKNRLNSDVIIEPPKTKIEPKISIPKNINSKKYSEFLRLNKVKNNEFWNTNLTDLTKKQWEQVRNINPIQFDNL